jgi:nucleotide-binding universal stress UspA family protein
MRKKPIVLHATDFSRASRAAFTAALAMARRERRDLEIFHVVLVPAVFVEDGWPLQRTADELAAAARRDAERRLRRMVETARKAGVRATAVARLGTPAPAIVREARRRRADVVVVGTHGRTGLSRFLLGSVAAGVVALAPCPVLTVRGR